MYTLQSAHDQVTGFVNGGFGLSPTVFSPLQSLLVNPANLAPGNTSLDTRYQGYLAGYQLPHLVLQKVLH